MPKVVKSGPGYQLIYQDDELVRRVVKFGDPYNFIGSDRKFRDSTSFQNRAVQQGVRGILEIRDARKGLSNDFEYQVTDFETDLYQLAREKEGLDGPGLLAILSQVVAILLEVQSRFKRTHGGLRLDSVLLRHKDRADYEIALTDFRAEPDLPYEKNDLRSFGQIII